MPLYEGPRAGGPSASGFGAKTASCSLDINLGNGPDYRFAEACIKLDVPFIFVPGQDVAQALKAAAAGFKPYYTLAASGRR
jgi:hypothetical protein